MPNITGHNKRRYFINKKQTMQIIIIRYHDYRKTEQHGQTSFLGSNYNAWKIASVNKKNEDSITQTQTQTVY